MRPTSIIEKIVDGNMTIDSESNSDNDIDIENTSRNHGQFEMKPGLMMPEINTQMNQTQLVMGNSRFGNLTTTNSQF